MPNSEFIFLNKTYTFNTLHNAQVLKTYSKTSHSERKLVKDSYGRLFHYRYDEEMRFGSDDDREDYLWVLVVNEADSDFLATQSRLSVLRPPYITADETYRVGVKE